MWACFSSLDHISTKLGLLLSVGQMSSSKAGAGPRRPAVSPWRHALRPESLLLSALLALAISSPLLYRQQFPARPCITAAALPSSFRRSEGFQQEAPGKFFAKRALVIYVYSGSDPEYEANLRFFVREAIQVRAPLPM